MNLHDVQPQVMELESLICAMNAYITMDTDTTDTEIFVLREKIRNTETLLIRAKELSHAIADAFYKSKDI